MDQKMAALPRITPTATRSGAAFYNPANDVTNLKDQLDDRSRHRPIVRRGPLPASSRPASLVGVPKRASAGTASLAVIVLSCRRGPGIASRHRPIMSPRAPASLAVIVLSSHRGPAIAATEIDLGETPNYPSSRAPDVAPWSPLRRLDVYRRSAASYKRAVAHFG
ncbi:hypothetical protein THAOC_18900 [Thalassiosira oceanica]|uniref:Uncharacterized protein n=1 Tax=Thalassiosira oceanica TaxID=159749 RepID=K0S3U8_THAOC|nr:hypothetical protein THAOC_18900 [Thalassiosira oceanica]|eukprot:EJK60698.1 hypothetical protein THAOC_18900 [Thalassiosira oceanica]